MHIDNKKKVIIVLGEGPTQRLDGTTITAEAKYSINFSRSQRKFCSCLHYNGSNSFLFINATKIYQFKAIKASKIKPYSLCLGNISKDFTANNMKKTGLNGYVYDFYVDYNVIYNSNVIGIHKYLLKKHDIR